MSTQYEVLKVPSGDKLVINFKGLTLMMRLVCIQAPEQGGESAQKALATLVEGKEVTIIPETSMGLSDDGLQQIYCFVRKEDNKQLFVNEELLRQGMARFRAGKTDDFKVFMDKLEALKNMDIPEHHLGKAVYCSELNSKRYHEASCKWVASINKQSLIKYDNYLAAEKASKEPCTLCLHARVKELRVLGNKQKDSGQNFTGALFGIEGDNKFYSPVALTLEKADPANVVRYASLKDAKDAGLKPDPSSLRLESAILSPPKGDECIGRCLPFFRPCLRPSNHPTGLCEACLNGRIK
ncbi:MAG: hypothetical protein HQL31_04125 [Planctomycetes bacterium]|nr:hypothetical protein [Planctomycetota bacterium]